MATITLALGIDANTAIFNIINAALLRSLPFIEGMAGYDLADAPGHSWS